MRIPIDVIPNEGLKLTTFSEEPERKVKQERPGSDQKTPDRVQNPVRSSLLVAMQFPAQIFGDGFFQHVSAMRAGHGDVMFESVLAHIA